MLSGHQLPRLVAAADNDLRLLSDMVAAERLGAMVVAQPKVAPSASDSRSATPKAAAMAGWVAQLIGDISDHVKDEPHELRIDGIITNTPASLEETMASSPTRAEDAYEKLLKLVERKRPVLVSTSKRRHGDMVITGVSRIRSASVGDAVQVSITARQIRTVQSQTVDAPARKKRSPKRNLGKKPKTPVSGKQGDAAEEGPRRGHRRGQGNALMSLFKIPTRTDLESYVEQVELDGVVYEFDLTWNQRDGAWYLSLSDADGKPIASGLRIVVDFPLLHYLGHPDKPPGTLMAIDTSGSGVDPGLNELGGRVQLVYHAVTE